jgi:hypothetical protein
MSGVGKSTRVAKPLGLPVVSTDDFLVGDGRYIDGLRLDDLREAIERHPLQVVVEGCCVLEVLARVGMRPDLHIYVRRINSAGLWEDKEVATGDDADHQMEVLREINEAVRRLSGDPNAQGHRLDAELIAYHAQYRPFQTADLVVDLLEDT